MTEQWIASVATAAVGLAGIAATWITGRSARLDQQTALQSQQRENRITTLRAERLSAYSRLTGYIAELHYITHQSSLISRRREEKADEDDLDPWVEWADSKASPLMQQVFRSFSEVQIIASPEVAALANKAVTDAIRFLAYSGDNNDRKGNAKTTITKARASLVLLQKAMASDLNQTVRSEEATGRAETDHKTSDVNKRLTAFLRRTRQPDDHS